MGKTLFFIILFLIFVGVIVFLWNEFKEPSTKTNEEKKEKPESLFKRIRRSFGRNSVEFTVGMVLLIGGLLIGWQVAIWLGKDKPSSNGQQPIVMPGELKLLDEPHVEEKRGVLSWYIPGRAGAVQKYSAKVIVHEMNSQLMDFTVLYEYNGETQKARFVHNKANGSYGNWTQNLPQDGGQWYLHRKSSNVFVGEQSDNTGRFIPMTLEL